MYVYTYKNINLYTCIHIYIYTYIILCRVGAKLLQAFWANKLPRNNFTAPKKVGMLF